MRRSGGTRLPRRRIRSRVAPSGLRQTRHALSLLSLGELGWIQIANFIGTGTLVVLGALGARRVLSGGRGGTSVPVLLGIWGVALVASGVFIADPAPDFPQGPARAASGLSTSGLLHFVAGAVGFYALAGAALVFTRRYWAEGRKGRSFYTLASVTGFLIAFGHRQREALRLRDAPVLCSGGLDLGVAHDGVSRLEARGGRCGLNVPRTSCSRNDDPRSCRGRRTPGRQGRITTNPSVACRRMRCPSRINPVACSTPTTAGRPYSRAITADEAP